MNITLRNRLEIRFVSLLVGFAILLVVILILAVNWATPRTSPARVTAPKNPGPLIQVDVHNAPPPEAKPPQSTAQNFVSSDPAPRAPATVERDDREKTVYVKGYYRKNGTYVKPHYKRPPKRKSKD